METQTIEAKKDANEVAKEFFTEAYNLAINHSIETVRRFLEDVPAADQLTIIEKLEKLKSL